MRTEIIAKTIDYDSPLFYTDVLTIDSSPERLYITAKQLTHVTFKGVLTSRTIHTDSAMVRIKLEDIDVLIEALQKAKEEMKDSYTQDLIIEAEDV